MSRRRPCSCGPILAQHRTRCELRRQANGINRQPILCTLVLSARSRTSTPRLSVASAPLWRVSEDTVPNCTTDGTQGYHPRQAIQSGGSGSYTVRMYHVDSPCVCNIPYFLLFILFLSPSPSIVFLPLCGAFVVLALVFLSGLCSTAYMTAFLA